MVQTLTKFLYQVGYDMTKNAAEQLYLKTGCRPSDVDVVELHDCFSANELITYEALGLCPPGKAGLLVDTGNNTYGGKYVVNPSGGLISKGHPLGATGMSMLGNVTMGNELQQSIKFQMALKVCKLFVVHEPHNRTLEDDTKCCKT